MMHRYSVAPDTFFPDLRRAFAIIRRKVNVIFPDRPCIVWWASAASFRVKRWVIRDSSGKPFRYGASIGPYSKKR